MHLNSDTKLASINAKTKILAVIGDPIEHSMSPLIHNAVIQSLGLNYVYIAFRVEPKELENAIKAIRAFHITGINITIPHKVASMQFVDEIDSLALEIGAINTIKNEDGRLKARNTDAEGSFLALKGAGFDLEKKKCVMLGAGGVAKAIAFILAGVADELIIVNRTLDKANELKAHLDAYLSNPKNKNHPYTKKKMIRTKIQTLSFSENTLKSAITNSNLLINCTSVGMCPNVNESPTDKFNLTFPEDLLVFDTIYNPIETKLLKKARSCGCRTLSGADMLVNQGASAFQWWTGAEPDRQIMQDILRNELIKMEKS
jgi:shikimate dehydrogenase